ncbi:MAG: OsmC family protein [Ardenticatenaceae bacterium]|nr:OsmC family protein [Anaerolineales bacterium]MCB8920959.1 OsmC family protein [Ardenticatenaceae bacterium]MCB8991615.1 OsmC family protein [Ardenticatenaceae bacterium]MCB9004244.1 OsmC family protein [Ardenticatenaceae bacterium]
MAQQKSAVLTWKGENLHFRGKLGSGYEFDVSGQSNAENGGSAMEFLLAGVAGCTAMDVVHVLRKMRQKFSGLRVEIIGDRAEEHPMVYTNVELVYVVTGKGIDATAVERAIALSQETYCSASVMFKRAGAVVKTSYRIEED